MCAAPSTAGPGSESEGSPRASAFSENDREAESQRRGLEFPPTRWSVVLQAAAAADPDAAREALATLSEYYLPVIRAYFRKKCGNSHDAEDLAGKAVEHLLEKNRFRNFQRRPGLRFRHYLSRTLKNIHLDHRPPPSGEPIDDYLDAQGEQTEIDKAIDAQCAVVIHDRVMAGLESKYRGDGKLNRFQALRRFILREPGRDDYADAARALGLEVNATRQAMFRLREAYVAGFRSEVGETVGHIRSELDEEMKYLFALVPKALADREGVAQ